MPSRGKDGVSLITEYTENGLTERVKRRIKKRMNHLRGGRFLKSKVQKMFSENSDFNTIFGYVQNVIQCYNDMHPLFEKSAFAPDQIKKAQETLRECEKIEKMDHVKLLEYLNVPAHNQNGSNTHNTARNPLSSPKTQRFPPIPHAAALSSVHVNEEELTRAIAVLLSSAHGVIKEIGSEHPPDHVIRTIARESSKLYNRGRYKFLVENLASIIGDMYYNEAEKLNEKTAKVLFEKAVLLSFSTEKEVLSLFAMLNKPT
jgi:hypothetical protein